MTVSSIIARTWACLALLALLQPPFVQLASAQAPARAPDKVAFATNWLAEAEHGGFYQALADGTYAKYGLDVKIVPGGPMANNRLLLATGKADFYLGANMIAPLDAVKQGVPTIVVASLWQKDPIILMSHPGQGFDRLEDLPKATAFLGKETLATVFLWLKQRYGFSENNVKPYTFNPAPFIADKKSIQQGYLTAEPYAVEQQGGFKPNVFLLADAGYNSYSTTIETRTDLVSKNPDLVQRFVDASIIGWYNYIYADNARANALIKRDNPDMTDGQIAFSVARMKDYGIVDSGDSLKEGIGTMNEARMQSFFEQMAKAGAVDGSVDWRKTYSLAFVNRKVGLDLRPR